MGASRVYQTARATCRAQTLDYRYTVQETGAWSIFFFLPAYIVTISNPVNIFRNAVDFDLVGVNKSTQIAVK
jgi:hypothetical protein